MEVGDKLKELNMTVDEIDRLTEAFKDEKFRDMLRDYAKELSDPENKKKYEEEIKLLEQERGNTIEFIHPEPFRALRTSVDGKQKCFINICASDKVGKPVSKFGVSEEGCRGQSWSLPYSLPPGRQDTDSKGNKIRIFDVIFHPDTLYIASKDKRFMDMVDGTAIQAIQDALKVTLDRNNVKKISRKYKGTPQPCVIRRAIPGFKAKEPSEQPDPLAFPYPEKRATTSSQTKPPESPVTKMQPQKTKEPTKPNYTVKYRSFIDLQDFRCSRDSAQSPRPKEIVVTIDLPLLKAVTDASLEVNKRKLLLECEKPAYRLELPLAYPVDEDEGEAKFNKQGGQLVVTLPVLPSSEAFDFLASDDGSPEEKSKREDLRSEEQKCVEEEEERGIKEEILKKQIRGEKSEKEEERGQEDNDVEEEECERQKGQEGVEEEKVKKQKLENGEQDGKTKLQRKQQYEELDEDECDRAAEKRETGAVSFQSESVDPRMNVMLEEKSCVASLEKENQPDHQNCTVREGGVNLTPKMTTSDVNEETEKMKDSPDLNLKVETAATSRVTVSPTPADTQIQNGCISKMCATKEANKLSRGGSGDMVTLCCEAPVTESVTQEDNVDEDDLPTEQILQNPEHDNHKKPPPVILREIDEDGNEKVISDHSTSVRINFQNTLIFELD